MGRYLLSNIVKRPISMNKMILLVETTRLIATC
jgi:hypothetical protein